MLGVPALKARFDCTCYVRLCPRQSKWNPLDEVKWKHSLTLVTRQLPSFDSSRQLSYIETYIAFHTLAGSIPAQASPPDSGLFPILVQGHTN